MFFKAFLTNSSGILVSRILGFIRDLLMATILGAGIYSDIFFVAFKLPNLFRRIFGEGAFNQSFLPSFLKARYKGGFALKVFLIFCILLLLLSLFVWVFSLEITKLLAYGFSEELIALTAPLVVINFWYLLLVFVVTFLGAILQYKRNFTAWAYSPAVLNLAMIVVLLLVQNTDSYRSVLYLSYGVLAGGVGQILLHIYPLWRLKFFKLFYVGIKELKAKKDSITQSVKSFNKQFFPAMIGSSTAQIASFVDTLLASFLSSGTISYLYYANRIFQLPLAVFAIATSVALFPLIAKYLKDKKEDLALSALKKPFWFLCFLLSACVVGGILLRNEIIWLLFERGRFLREDTLLSAAVFSAYMIGLLPFGLAKIFSLWLYSQNQQSLAAKISAFSLVVGIFCSLVLMQFFQAVGLALAGSISGIVLLLLTLHYFGWDKFFTLIRDWRLIALWILSLCVEVLLISAFKHFVFEISS
ncbi:murein biosynthesis integral membrane protein MurJ [Helicobacter mesocricetorum]|uniref:murein biosynthesis integral membrane protein MurJ n=1 Tax=Helicobacter mesocricetorum TaxID=87012 RepID=UPI000CF1C41A|nr:murein biosynthesis integral membrane protein MurJ [Helicobacter mesocricetorum]